MNTVTLALIGLGLGVAALATVFVLIVVALYWRNPDKTREMLGTLALFFKSIEKTRKHKRAEDVAEHTHRRHVPRKSLALTMTEFARRDRAPEHGDRHDPGHRGRSRRASDHPEDSEP